MFFSFQECTPAPRLRALVLHRRRHRRPEPLDHHKAARTSVESARGAGLVPLNAKVGRGWAVATTHCTASVLSESATSRDRHQAGHASNAETSLRRACGEAAESQLDTESILRPQYTYAQERTVFLRYSAGLLPPAAEPTKSVGVAFTGALTRAGRGRADGRQASESSLSRQRDSSIKNGRGDS